MLKGLMHEEQRMKSRRTFSQPPSRVPRRQPKKGKVRLEARVTLRLRSSRLAQHHRWQRLH